MSSYHRRWAAALLIALAVPSTASADTIGKAQAGPFFCDANVVLANEDDVVPAIGRITSFSFESNGINQFIGTKGQHIDFKVLRPQTGGDHLVVGETGLKTLATFTDVETFTPAAPIAVRPGDRIGFFTPDPLLGCIGGIGSGNTASTFVLADPAVGSSVTLFPTNPAAPNVSAEFTADSADLAVSKTGPATVAAGQNATYTISVTNSGPDGAEDVTLSDFLPSGTTFVSLTQTSGPAFSCTTPAVGAGGAVTCTNASVASGATASFTFVVAVSPSYDGSTVSNTATVSSAIADPVSENDSDTTTASVTRSADLGVTKVDSADPVNVGDTLTYTITASNNGPSNASGVTVTDQLPAGLQFVSATPSKGSYDPVTGVWSVGDLATGGTATLTLNTKVTGPAAIKNTAVIDGNESDPNDKNDRAEENTSVRSASLTLTKSDSADPVTVDGTFSYTVAVANAGPDTATGVEVTDVLPTGVEFISATPTQGSYNATTGKWTVGSIAAGSTPQLTINVKAKTTGQLSNTATISHSDVYDPNDKDDSDTETTQVNPKSADLSITKKDSADPVTVGSTFNYTLAYANAGPGAAENVSVTDVLPAGVQLVSAPGCTGTTTLTCAVGTLASGGSGSFVITVKATQEGVLSNTATIASSTADPDDADRTATETTRVSGYSCDRKGTAGADTITGTAKDEVLCGLGGNDTIRGGGGNDIIVGGDGLDKLYGEAGFDRLNGGIGDDLLDGGDGADNLQGFDGNDSLFGKAGPDQLFGQNGNDKLDGGADRDECSQGAGTGTSVSCP